MIYSDVAPSERLMPSHSLRGIPKTSGSENKIAVSLMSDTKWRKLFYAVDDPFADAPELGQAIIKLIDVDDEKVISTLKGDAPNTPYPYVDTFQYGPIRWRDIEWIEFPKVAEYPRPSPNGLGRVPPKMVKLEIGKLEDRLSKLGNFPVERTERGLRINGYRRHSGGG